MNEEIETTIKVKFNRSRTPKANRWIKKKEKEGYTVESLNGTTGMSPYDIVADTEVVLVKSEPLPFK